MDNNLLNSLSMLQQGMKGVTAHLNAQVAQLSNIDTSNLTPEQKAKYGNILEGFKSMGDITQSPAEAKKKIESLEKELKEFEKTYKA